MGAKFRATESPLIQPTIEGNFQESDPNLLFPQFPVISAH